MKPLKGKSLVVFICAALCIVTIAAFWPLGNNEFINYDDNEYITKNSPVREGLTRSGFAWAFTSTVSHHWHPLTWLSHMLDCEIFGLNPIGHHLTNLLLHILNTILLFLIFNSVTNKPWQSFFLAALFAIHPLHVESVAWASERKDTLSSLFWFLTMASYFSYVRRGRLSMYFLSLIFFALGLMSKPMLVTLPMVLLLMDYWPLRRFGFKSLAPLKMDSQSAPLRRIALEKVPFFALSAISSVITLVIMKQGGIVVEGAELAFTDTLANVLVSYIGYIVRTFVPVRLAPFYPHPGTTLTLWQATASAVLLGALTLSAFYFARKRRVLIVGWLWYLVTLLPVIGLLQVGAQAMADRYTYVPLTGLFLCICFTVSPAIEKSPRIKYAAAGIFALIILILIPLTYRQVSRWRNSQTLFEYTITVTSNNYLAHNNLANALGQKGLLDDSIYHALEAIRIKPKHETGHYNLAMAYYYKGDTDKAVSHWQRALELRPTYREVNFNLAMAYLKLNQQQKALHHLKAELEINPSHQKAQETLKSPPLITPITPR